MSDSVRVRFAPSPTGQVHIGNIRVAIFNYLYARSRGGRFLLRVEDTDRERSTPEAVDALLAVLDWLELRPDEPPLYQSSRIAAHVKAAENLIGTGMAYRHARTPEEAPALFFRFPLDGDKWGENLKVIGPETRELFAGARLRIDATGIEFSGVSRKGKEDPGGCCLAGMADARVFDAAGKLLFDLSTGLNELLAGGVVFETTEAVQLEFTRREIVFADVVKGPMRKPLDSLRDLVLVRGDGNPVFHLANVCDDLEQGVTHVIRGDDHVENTFRHVGLIRALGGAVPVYAHLPMIVNAAGKPYSKRDGDAFVGDFRDKGYLPEALLNYLALLGWSPGDEREKLNRDELIAAFSLERVQRSPAQMDLNKLANLNSAYLNDLPQDLYLADVRELLDRQPWSATLTPARWTEIALLMRPRLRTYAEVLEWDWFAGPGFVRDPDALKRGLGKAWQREAAERLQAGLERGLDLAEARAETATALGLEDTKLNQPLRAALTGRTSGPDLALLLPLLDPRSLADRLRISLESLSQAETSV